MIITVSSFLIFSPKYILHKFFKISKQCSHTLLILKQLLVFISKLATIIYNYTPYEDISFQSK
jgi:hypothetical protein